MNAQTTAAAPAVIEIGDTVRLVGRKGKGIVESINGDKISISYSWRVNRNTTGISVRDYATDRVELVRKGSAEGDAIAELDAMLDARDTRAATALGETLKQYRTRGDAEAKARTAAMAAAQAAATAAREAKHAATAAAKVAAAEARAAAEIAEAEEMARGAAEVAAHLPLHDGDFFAMLLCGVGGAACPLA